MTLGEKIRNLRNKANMSQKELATRLKVKNTVISNWENNLNKPNVDYISAMCAIFDVSPNYFFKLDIPNANVSSIVPADLEILKKYHQLDLRGQQAVLDTLNREYSYIKKGNNMVEMSEIASDAIDTVDKISEDMFKNQHDSVHKK